MIAYLHIRKHGETVQLTCINVNRGDVGAYVDLPALAGGGPDVMNFAFEIRRESNPRSYLTRSSTLTTRPTVYIQLVPKVPITC